MKLPWSAPSQLPQGPRLPLLELPRGMAPSDPENLHAQDDRHDRSPSCRPTVRRHETGKDANRLESEAGS